MKVEINKLELDEYDLLNRLYNLQDKLEYVEGLQELADWMWTRKEWNEISVEYVKIKKQIRQVKERLSEDLLE